MSATKFINHSEILDTIRYAAENANNRHLVDAILDKAKDCRGLTHREAAVLLESTDPEGPIGKFVEKNGGGMHHIAFAVDDVAQALNEAEAAGCQLIDKAPRGGAEGLQIGFLHPKSTLGVLTELCEKPE